VYPLSSPEVQFQFQFQSRPIVPEDANQNDARTHSLPHTSDLIRQVSSQDLLLVVREEISSLYIVHLAQSKLSQRH